MMMDPMPDTYARTQHLLSVDVDDLLIANADFYEETLEPGYASRIEEEVAAALEVLGRTPARATFFVNGQYGDRLTDLLKEVVARGHTIASHGYRHRSVIRLSLQEFEEDLCRSLEHLTRIQSQVIGYRPPAFSMPYDDAHLGVLVKHGIRYVSSGVGVARSDAPRSNTPVEVRDRLLHVPISTAHLLGGRIKYPIGYGITSRLMPEAFYKFTLRRWLRREPYFHWYCHSFELSGLPRGFRIPYRQTSARLATSIYAARCRNRGAYLATVLASADFRSIESSLFADSGAWNS